jgi:hypothetical protein
MKRRFMTSICITLLVWAAIDDALAAQTPDPDDDVAAALDNDCLQSEPVKVPTRAEADVNSVPLVGGIHIASSPAAAISTSLGSYPVSQLLYLFMSLQR